VSTCSPVSSQDFVIAHLQQRRTRFSRVYRSSLKTGLAGSLPESAPKQQEIALRGSLCIVVHDSEIDEKVFLSCDACSCSNQAYRMFESIR